MSVDSRPAISIPKRMRTITVRVRGSEASKHMRQIDVFTIIGSRLLLRFRILTISFGAKK